MTVTTTLIDTVATFDPTPSVARAGDVTVAVARADAGDGRRRRRARSGPRAPCPRQLGLDRASLAASGFDGKVGQTLVVPRGGGACRRRRSASAIPATLDARRSCATRRPPSPVPPPSTAPLATTLADVGGVAAEVAGQAVVEGILLARYRYGALKKDVPAVGAAVDHARRRRRRAPPAVERGADAGRRRPPAPPSWPATSPTRRPGT